VSLDDFPRHPLLLGPGPVHPLVRLSAHLGGPKIWAKREDCISGLAFGGNKTRKGSTYGIPVKSTRSGSPGASRA
jgi:1-aminocyclopropane-1-carboxylate deaminase